MTCVYLEPVAYNGNDIIGSLEDDPTEVPQPPRLRVIHSGSASISGLVETVLRAGEGNRNEALNWAAWRAGQDPQVDTQQAGEELLKAAIVVGLKADEATRTIRSGLEASS